MQITLVRSFKCCQNAAKSSVKIIIIIIIKLVAVVLMLHEKRISSSFCTGLKSPLFDSHHALLACCAWLWRQ